jgi:hypothetical protein
MRYDRSAHGIKNATGFSECVKPDEIDDANEKAENFTAESSDQAYETTSAESAQGENHDSSPYDDPCIPLDAKCTTKIANTSDLLRIISMN